MNPTIDFIFDEFVKYLLYASGAVSIIVNIFAVYVILTRSSKFMKGYKWILLHVTIACGFTDCVVSILLTPVPIQNGVGTTMYGILGRLFPSHGRIFCILIDVCIFYTIWANLVCFVYRLYLLTAVKYMWIHKYLVLLLFTSLLSIVGSVLIYIPALAPEERIREYAKELGLVENDYALWLITPENFTANTRWGLYCISIILATYVMFAIITMTVDRILKRPRCFSKGSIAYHRMLLKSLIMQTTIPMLTVVFPIFITGLAQKLKQDPATLPYARLCSVPGMLMLSNYSVSHVAVMLCYTTPYNEYITKCIHRYSSRCSTSAANEKETTKIVEMCEDDVML